jgi:NADPH2:quinone reductase
LFEDRDPSNAKILGYDGAGIISSVGPDCKLNFKVGDEVYFAGNLMRNGTNAEFCAVDERLVALKPKSLNFADAAAFPLVTLTGWENLIEDARINEEPEVEKAILILPGAGGTGAFGIQLCKQFPNVKVIATASRTESADYCKQMGADFVIDHKKNLKEQLTEIGFSKGADVIFCGATGVVSECIKALAPLGKILTIVPFLVDTNDDMMSMVLHRQSVHYGLMFARSLYDVQPEKQGEILKKVSDMIDNGKIQTITGKKFTGFTVENMRAAHQLQANGKMMGKIVVEF